MAHRRPIGVYALSAYILLSPSTQTAFAANQEFPTDSSTSNYYCSSVTSNDTCTIRCQDGSKGVTINCGLAGHCEIHCDEKKCLESAILNASNSQSLSIQSSSQECLKSASVYLPDSGTAVLQNYPGSKSYKQAKIYAGSNTQSILIDCNDGGTASNDDCKQLEVYAETAQYLEITAGADTDITDAIINCPQNSSYSGPELPPCIIDITGGGLIDGVTVKTLNGAPFDFWIKNDDELGNIAALTLWCNGSNVTVSNQTHLSTSSLSNCMQTKFSNTTAPTLSPTVSQSLSPSSESSTSPTMSTLSPSQSSSASNSPTASPSQSPSVSPTVAPFIYSTIMHDWTTSVSSTVSVSVSEESTTFDVERNVAMPSSISTSMPLFYPLMGVALLLIFCLVLLFVICAYRSWRKTRQAANAPIHEKDGISMEFAGMSDKATKDSTSPKRVLSVSINIAKRRISEHISMLSRAKDDSELVGDDSEDEIDGNNQQTKGNAPSDDVDADNVSMSTDDRSVFSEGVVKRQESVSTINSEYGKEGIYVNENQANDAGKKRLHTLHEHECDIVEEALAEFPMRPQ